MIDRRHSNLTRVFISFRIVWSLVWLIVGTPFVAIWARSYWYADQIYGQTSPTNVLHFGSMRGQVTLRRITDYNGTGIVRNWLTDSEPIAAIMLRRQQSFPKGQDDLVVYRFNSHYDFGTLSNGIYLPHWLFVVSIALMSTVPWLLRTFRFRLRTLLLFIAVASIGLTVAMSAIR